MLKSLKRFAFYFFAFFNFSSSESTIESKNEVESSIVNNPLNNECSLSFVRNLILTNQIQDYTIATLEHDLNNPANSEEHLANLWKTAFHLKNYDLRIHNDYFVSIFKSTICPTVADMPNTKNNREFIANNSYGYLLGLCLQVMDMTISNTGNIHIQMRAVVPENTLTFQTCQNIIFEPKSFIEMTGKTNAKLNLFSGKKELCNTEYVYSGQENIIFPTSSIISFEGGGHAIRRHISHDCDSKCITVYKNKQEGNFFSVYVNPDHRGITVYHWIHDITSLQKICQTYGRYALSGNIDATETRTWNEGAGFKPCRGRMFFDGQGYTIKNLFINRPNDKEPVAFFSDFLGSLEASIIMSPDKNTIKGILNNEPTPPKKCSSSGFKKLNNLNFENANITGGEIVAYVAGKRLAEGNFIENVHVTNSLLFSANHTTILPAFPQLTVDDTDACRVRNSSISP